jgi:hypothetical protein
VVFHPVADFGDLCINLIVRELYSQSPIERREYPPKFEKTIRLSTLSDSGTLCSPAVGWLQCDGFAP